MSRHDSHSNGAARWLAIHDDLLRGMTHALSNRLATLLATVSLLEAAPGSPTTALAALHTEGDRLDGVLRLLRQLPRRGEEPAEPFLPTDVAQSALDLHAFHPDSRDLAGRLVTDGDPVPAWANPPALQLALVAALTSARRDAGAHDVTEISMSSTDDEVRFDVRASAGARDDADVHARREEDASAAAYLLGDSGGTVTATDRGIQVCVPSLAAVRRLRQR